MKMGKVGSGKGRVQRPTEQSRAFKERRPFQEPASPVEPQDTPRATPSHASQRAMTVDGVDADGGCVHRAREMGARGNAQEHVTA